MPKNPFQAILILAFTQLLTTLSLLHPKEERVLSIHPSSLITNLHPNRTLPLLSPPCRLTPPTFEPIPRHRAMTTPLRRTSDSDDEIVRPKPRPNSCVGI